MTEATSDREPEVLSISELIESLEQVRYEAGSDVKTRATAAYWDGEVVTVDVPSVRRQVCEEIEAAIEKKLGITSRALPIVRRIKEAQ